MNSRPKDPKTARNKNVLVVGGSGSGKTRFFIKPNLMQLHSSYVVTDPKGSIVVECGKLLHQHLNDHRPNGYADEDIPQLRNKRDVWQINTVPYRGRHFAAFPPKLAETCLLAGCPPEGVVLDPFLGSGTTAAVAKQLGRHYIGIELNPEYCTLAEKRIGGVAV